MAGNILGISHNVYFVSDITISIIINIPKHYHFSTRKLRLMEVNYQLGLPSGAGAKGSACSQETKEIWVRSLDPEDPLEKKMATHSSILA